MNLNLRLKIISCKNISLFDQCKALQDLRMMRENSIYAKHCEYDPEQEYLSESFLWNRSILGSDFWMLIDSKIEYYENS